MKQFAPARSPAPGQSLADVAPAVAAEFVACVSQPARTPETLRPASNLMCWWRCAACGTEFCAIPAARTRGRGCGVCGGERTRRARMTAPPGGSLKDLHPALAEELVGCVPDPDLSSGQLLPGSNKACRWCCSVCAHTWTAAVATRTTGGGCPAGGPPVPELPPPSGAHWGTCFPTWLPSSSPILIAPRACPPPSSPPATPGADGVAPPAPGCGSPRSRTALATAQAARTVTGPRARRCRCATTASFGKLSPASSGCG